MLKKIGVLIVLIVLSFVILAQTPPTDPDGQVVFMPQGPTGADKVTIRTEVPEGRQEGEVSPKEGEVSPKANSVTNGTAQCDISSSGASLGGIGEVVGEAYIDCSGDWTHTRLIAVLQRHLWGPWWVNIDSETKNWAAEARQEADLSGNCASGEHTYRTVADGWVRDGYGQITYGQHVSGHSWITC